jgi:hypothetical protein
MKPVALILSAMLAGCAIPHRVIDVYQAGIECLQDTSILMLVQIDKDDKVVAKHCRKVKLGKDS